VHLRLGAGGSTPKHAIHADWGELSEIARRCGHGGGDFWVLYYFARQLLYGEPAPFDIYNAADVTIPGILAYRSGLEGGKPYDIPDFRDPAALEVWRGDTWAQPHPEPAVVSFPETAHNADTAQFNEIIKKLIEHMHLIRSYMDWSVVAEDLIEPESIAPMKEKLLQQLPDIRENTAKARALAEAYPGTNGARALLELLELATVEEATAMLEAGR